MPTIQDVAKRAGVSPITVSRVINHFGYCSKDAQQRVEAAIIELGYVPNSLARSLRIKKTHTLGLVLTDITNPFFTTLARGVEDAASKAGFMVILCNTDESEIKEANYLQLLLQKQVDGILLVPAVTESKSIPLIRKQNIPVVVLDRRVPGFETDVVRCNSEVAAYQLTRLLLEQGHQRIAILSGRKVVFTAEERVQGYQRAMREANLQDSEIVFYGEFNQQSGYEMTRDALALDPCPTALLAANNFIAFGAFKALQEMNLRIPEDISLVAFDDLPPSFVMFPFLTVAYQPSYEMGKKATELLLSRLSGESPDTYQEIDLPVEVMIRRSSGIPRTPALV